MPETLLSKLEASRKELLDLGMRNSLLNFKQLKSKGVHIADEQSSSDFNILVTKGKTTTFLPRKAPEVRDELFPQDPKPPQDPQTPKEMNVEVSGLINTAIHNKAIVFDAWLLKPL